MMPDRPAAIAVRAPLRISFGGGGTDLPAYYARHGGFVLSAAIARYCYAVARQPQDRRIRITSADYGCSITFGADSVPALDEPLALPRAAIGEFVDRGLHDRGVDLFLRADVRPGTGLGSSSAMAVALIGALSAYVGAALTTAEVAELACALEIERLGMPIGKQDQYASAFGGMNTITFGEESASPADGCVRVRPLDVPPAVLAALAARLLLFSTGRSHNSASILRQQQADTRRNTMVVDRLHGIKALAREMDGALQAGELDQFGHLLDRAWQIKRRLSRRISSPEIDALYAAARAAGALGGKITGAGGGGYLLLYCPVEHQPRVRAAMAAFGVEELAFGFDRTGVQLMASPGEC
jgi:D-glycero-alpha-D-manno-heptose-7-phosphate kinase